MEKWQAKVAVVTGGNSGNGYAILKKLAESGLIVVAFDLITDAIDVSFTEFYVENLINLKKNSYFFLF